MNIRRLRTILRKRRFWSVVYVALVLVLHHVWTKRLAPFLATLATVGVAFAILFVVQQAGQKPPPALQPVPLTLSPPLVSQQPPLAASQPQQEDWDALKHRWAREEKERERLLNLHWPVVLRMKEDDYAASVPGNHYAYRDAISHYADCLLQRAHYRMRRMSRAKRHQLRRLEKAMEDWAQAYWDFANGSPSADGGVFSAAHLECGHAIDTIVAHYHHPKRLPYAAQTLHQEVQKLIAAREKLEGPINRRVRHAREQPGYLGMYMEDKDNSPETQEGLQETLNQQAEKLRRATLRLRRETKSLHDEPAEAVAQYIQKAKSVGSGPDDPK